MDLDVEYDNRKRVPEHPAIFARWDGDAAQFRASAAGEIDIPYGEHPRQRFDWFASKDDRGGPICVFIHGGYWRSLAKHQFSHFALGPSFHGIPMAVAEYRLCPEVEVTGIIDDMRACCLALWRRHRRRLVPVGHSAGGHLASALLATDWQKHGAPAGLVPSAMSISGLFDLRPLMKTYINADLRLTEESARAASPLLWPSPVGRRFDALVGGRESSEFLRQSLTITAAWLGAGVHATYGEVPDTDHFTVLDPLVQPDSPMTRALASLCESAAVAA